MDRITPFRRLTGFLMLLACLFLVALPAWSGTVDTIANPRQTNGSWVSDGAGVLQPQTEARLNQLIDQLEARNGSEIAVVTMDAVPKDQTAKTLATALFNRWGIGKADVNNGLLFLVAVDDRRLEVETGYGTETVLPDARVGRILDEQVVPRLRSGEIEAGIVAGTEAFVDVLFKADFAWRGRPSANHQRRGTAGLTITLFFLCVWGGGSGRGSPC